jgi:hypothetical protein
LVILGNKQPTSRFVIIHPFVGTAENKGYLLYHRLAPSGPLVNWPRCAQAKVLPVTDKLKESARTSSPEPNIFCYRAQPYPNFWLLDREPAICLTTAPASIIVHLSISERFLGLNVVTSRKMFIGNIVFIRPHDTRPKGQGCTKCHSSFHLLFIRPKEFRSSLQLSSVRPR